MFWKLKSKNSLERDKRVKRLEIFETAFKKILSSKNLIYGIVNNDETGFVTASILTCLLDEIEIIPAKYRYETVTTTRRVSGGSSLSHSASGDYDEDVEEQVRELDKPEHAIFIRREEISYIVDALMSRNAKFVSTVNDFITEKTEWNIALIKKGLEDVA